MPDLRTPSRRLAIASLLAAGACSDSTAPTRRAPAIDEVALDLGAYQACGVVAAGGVRCWGLTDPVTPGASAPTLAPTAVAGTETLRHVSVGVVNHACGLTREGTAWCWGGNDAGQLGDGTTELRRAPVRVAGDHVFAQLDVGGYQSCAVDRAGAAWCWGAPQLASSNATSTVPVAVSAALRFRMVSAGARSTCALAVDGATWCWGDNRHGQLGDGTLTDRVAPTRVEGAPAFASITVGPTHACGLTAAGAAWCWGRNELLALGDGTTEPRRLTPVAVVDGHRYAQLAAGSEYTCGLLASGEALCWGWNADGQLGIGTRSAAARPTPVAGGLAFRRIAPGSATTLAITRAGALYGWGANYSYMLGRSDFLQPDSLPRAIAGAPAF